MDNFIDKCLGVFKNYFSNDINSFLKYPQKRLESKKEYFKFL